MRLSPSPDLGPWRRLIAVTFVVGFTVSIAMALKHGMSSFGDTDDATRLVIVRDLLSGRGWYDQSIARLSPPTGVYLHWSRLLDGGIAALMRLFGLFLTSARAEWWGRYLWPLAWIFPAVGGALALARNLGGRSAVLLAAILLLIDLQLYRQFTPGRIDHHNIQITMTVIALAGATARGHRVPWAIAAGLATALGLAVGLEALPLQALAGASFGLALARDRKAAAPASAYGLTLAFGSLALFGLQTPPWRWSLTFCDALAINLVAALVVAGLGLALAAWGSARAPDRVRLALLALVGVAAAGTYLGLAPRCIHGPFADMDPAVLPFWFNKVQEVQPLPKMFNLARDAAIVASIAMVMALASGGYILARERRAPSTSSLLILAAIVVACVTAWFTWRMQDYVFWIGLPALGAALSLLCARRLGDLMVPSVVLVIVVSPMLVGATVATIAREAQKASGAPPPRSYGGPTTEKCFARGAYAQLAALPPGVVLSEQDLGPFILAFTSHSALTAPYHRMSHEILSVHQALNAPPGRAEAAVRRLGANYIVDCPPYPMGAAVGTFGAGLRLGQIPPWLTALSAPKATLRIYRVLRLNPPNPVETADRARR